MTIYGDGSQSRSFCYCDDLVDGIIALSLQNEVAGPINIGNDGEFTMLELAQNIIDITGSKSKIIYEPLPQDDPKQRKPNITKAKDLLGWEPKVDRSEGLKKTLEYFQKHI